MGVAQITNPLGAYGQEAEPHMVDIPLKTTTVVSANDLVELVWDEATEIVTCRRADTDVNATPAKLGVAQEAGPANSTVSVRIGGLARVNIGAGAVAAGEKVIATANAGEADGAAAAAGNASNGVFLGDEIGVTNTAPIWLG